MQRQAGKGLGATKLDGQHARRECEHLDLDSCLVEEFYAQTTRPVMILGRKGELALANAAAKGALPLPPDGEAEGAWWTAILPPPEERKAREAFVKALRGQIVVRGVVRPSTDGRTLAFEMVPLRNKDGDVHAVAVSLNDITEQLEGRRLSEALNVLQETISSTLDVDTIMQQVVELARTTMGAVSTAIVIKRGRRWRIDYASGQFPSVGKEMSDAEAKRSFPPLVSREALYIEDIMKVEGLRHDLLIAHRIRSALFAPLWLRGKIAGLMIFNYDRTRKFSPIELDYARKIGAAVSLALENSRALAKEKGERRLLQQVVENSPAAIALLTYPELKLTLVNELFRAMTGGERDFRKVMKFMPEKAAERVLKVLEEAHRTGEAYLEKEMPIRLSAGGQLYWDIHIVPLSGGMEGDLLIVASDVTSQVEDRKRIEDLVRITDNEKARLEAVLENLPVGVLMSDLTGRSVVTNEAFRSFFPFPPTGMEVDLPRMEGRWSDTGIRLKPEDWPIVRALQGERVVGAMIDVRRKDGEMRTVIASTSPVIGRKGPIGAVLVISDITEQRHAEQEAVQARSRMELYLDLLSHDVNNLNAGAKGYLELMLDKGELSGRDLDFAKKADDLLEDVAQLVENVRKLQKVEAEWHQRSLIDLNWLIEDVAASHRSTAGREVSIEFQPEERALVNANELLRDVFNNLIGNAIKHTEDPVEIAIAINRVMVDGREFYRVDIEDNGPGIPDNVKPVLFNRMQRGRTTAKGHGLGLYLVRTVLNMFDGRVWADDRVPGDHTQGSRFVVLLPVAEAGTPA